MHGSDMDPGLCPRICHALLAPPLNRGGHGIFCGGGDEQANQRETQVLGLSVSYLEIYNERVRDLLVGMEGRRSSPSNSASSNSGLRVRDYAGEGVTVEGK